MVEVTEEGESRTPVPLATLKPSVLPTVSAREGLGGCCPPWGAAGADSTPLFQAALVGVELSPPVTFHLRAGSGPVFISGQHVSCEYRGPPALNPPQNGVWGLSRALPQ